MATKIKETCCEEIMDGFHLRKCDKPAGHGPDKKHCWQHNPARIEKQAKEKNQQREEKICKEMHMLAEREDRRLRISILLSLAEGISTKNLKECQLIS